MPALLERPKLSSAMARALHRHVMVERERKRQGEEPGRAREGLPRRAREACLARQRPEPRA